MPLKDIQRTKMKTKDSKQLCLLKLLKNKSKANKIATAASKLYKTRSALLTERHIKVGQKCNVDYKLNKKNKDVNLQLSSKN
jgi:hypothetical protein